MSEGDGEGSTYTTISARPGEAPQIGVSFHLDRGAWIAVCGVEAGRPHLSILHGDVSVRITPCSPDAVTADDAPTARLLADQAATYAAELERLCAGGDAGGPGRAVV
jgi:hypothetical protein